MKRIIVKLLGAVAVCAALDLPSSSALAQVFTFTNPTPVSAGRFGYAVAALGTDRVLIGAVNEKVGGIYAGAAYLFTTNGTLLTTFTNPTPVNGDSFGCSLAAVGTDRVLIGAYGDGTGAGLAGAAYLFSTNGALLTSFHNPSPVNYGYFGWSVAALGTDCVLIGAEGNNTGATYSGAAYLFSTSGALIKTFISPKVSAGARFGCSVAAVGVDRGLVGAYGDSTGASAAGTAYLFNTNGTLLTTFTNPTPAANEYFGISVAAVGTDLVLIGADGDNTGATLAGTAYLFNTNAALLTTITNPTPTSNAYEHFGNSVAAVGADRVLIGAYHDSAGAGDSGAAYLFSTNGTLLLTIPNPTPGGSDYFGCSVAAVGTDAVLIGAYGDNTGAPDAGAAYLYSANGALAGRPSLTLRLTSTNTVCVGWPQPDTGWKLQATTNLVPGGSVWAEIPPPYSTNATSLYVVEPTPVGNKFYRLRKP